MEELSIILGKDKTKKIYHSVKHPNIQFKLHKKLDGNMKKVIKINTGNFKNVRYKLNISSF